MLLKYIRRYWNITWTVEVDIIFFSIYSRYFALHFFRVIIPSKQAANKYQGSSYIKSKTLEHLLFA